MKTEERLERLEEEMNIVKHRRSPTVVGSLVVAVLLVFLGLLIGGRGATAQDALSIADEVRAHRFTLLDETGKTRAVLEVFQDESVLAFFEDNFKSVLKLSGSKEGSTLILSRKGEIRAMLKVDEAGSNLTLVDEEDKMRASLGTGKDGGFLILYDKSGMPRVGLSATQIGPAVLLFDEIGKPRALLATTKNGPYLHLIDKNDKIRVKVRVDEDGPALELADANGKLRTGLGVGQTQTPDGKTITYPESSMLFFDPDGKIIGKLPIGR